MCRCSRGAKMSDAVAETYIENIFRSNVTERCWWCRRYDMAYSHYIRIIWSADAVPQFATMHSTAASSSLLDRSLEEQLFTCKLGVRKPTHSGKSPLPHSRHFVQMGWLILFRYSMAGRGGNLRKISITAATRCHFKAKMHQIWFRRWGSLQRSPVDLTGLIMRGRREGNGKR